MSIEVFSSLFTDGPSAQVRLDLRLGDCRREGRGRWRGHGLGNRALPLLACRHRFDEVRVLARHRCPIAFLCHIVARPSPQCLRHFRARDQQVQVLENQVLFARAHRHFEAHLFGELRKRPDFGDHHRLAQAQRPQQRAGALTDGRITQVQHDVAGRQVAHEIFDGSEAQDANVGRKTHGADHLIEGKLGMRFAHQNHAGIGRQAHQASKRAQRFGDPLVRLQIAEDADQGSDFV